MDARRRTRLTWLLGALLVMTLCFIWGNSLLGREASAGLSRKVYLWLRSIGVSIRSELFLRKLAHFCEFGAVGAELSLLLLIRGGRGFQGICNSAFAALLIAVTDEALQLVSQRGSSVADVLLDFAGALTGILAATLITRLLPHNKKN